MELLHCYWAQQVSLFWFISLSSSKHFIGLKCPGAKNKPNRIPSQEASQGALLLPVTIRLHTCFSLSLDARCCSFLLSLLANASAIHQFLIFKMIGYSLCLITEMKNFAINFETYYKKELEDWEKMNADADPKQPFAGTFASSSFPFFPPPHLLPSLAPSYLFLFLHSCFSCPSPHSSLLASFSPSAFLLFSLLCHHPHSS